MFLTSFYQPHDAQFSKNQKPRNSRSYCTPCSRCHGASSSGCWEGRSSMKSISKNLMKSLFEILRSPIKSILDVPVEHVSSLSKVGRMGRANKCTIYEEIQRRRTAQVSLLDQSHWQQSRKRGQYPFILSIPGRPLYSTTYSSFSSDPMQYECR